MSIVVKGNDPIIEKCALLLFRIEEQWLPVKERERMVSRMFKYLIPEIEKLRKHNERLLKENNQLLERARKAENSG